MLHMNLGDDNSLHYWEDRRSPEAHWTGSNTLYLPTWRSQCAVLPATSLSTTPQNPAFSNGHESTRRMLSLQVRAPTSFLVMRRLVMNNEQSGDVCSRLLMQTSSHMLCTYLLSIHC